MSQKKTVDLRGLEPLTPCMPCRCATSCATGPRRPRVLHLPIGRRHDREVEGNHRTVFPQSLELIESTLVFMEDVHDELAEIQENPAPPLLSFPSKKLRPRRVKLLVDCVSNRLHVSLAPARHNQKNVGECQALGHIKSNGFYCTLGPRGAGSALTGVYGGLRINGQAFLQEGKLDGVGQQGDCNQRTGRDDQQESRDTQDDGSHRPARLADDFKLFPLTPRRNCLHCPHG